MLIYDKQETKEQLTTEMIFDIVDYFGGEPEYTEFGFISKTICHNKPSETHKKKLYYYENTKLFNCYTGCSGYFDIFDLLVNVYRIQFSLNYNLSEVIYRTAQKYNIDGKLAIGDAQSLKDWDYFDNYNRIKNISINNQEVSLKEYDRKILERLSYPKIGNWIKEGMSEEVLREAQIGYYPTMEQITIPHFDINGKFIGLRGRALGAQEAALYGKYRPIKMNGILYSHPLSLNLYNLNNTKDNIKIIKKAIIFEGEKSCLLYKTYFTKESDISVACCGSNISNYQIQLLLGLKIQELVIAFDRQFKKIGDEECDQLEKKLLGIKNKYSPYVKVSFIFDKFNLLGYKDSPVDKGKEIFIKLFEKRVKI